MREKLLNNKILINKKYVNINISVNKNAKRIILKFDHLGCYIKLVLPLFVSKEEGLEFVYKNTSWLSKELMTYPSRIYFEEYQLIPYLGKEYKIINIPTKKKLIKLDSSNLYVFSDKLIISNVIKDWFLKSSNDYIFKLASEKAKLLNLNFKKISIRDQKTRWGSCSEKGNLSFSWRLIMSPPEVIEYVVVHEICHLKQMNHSTKFWRLVDSICTNRKKAQNWLKKNGTKLHFYG